VALGKAMQELLTIVFASKNPKGMYFLFSEE
jgi:hypothetical protein